MSVYVYNGDGTECVDVLMNSLNETLTLLKQNDTHDTKCITAQELRETAWLGNGKLLIMPGGRDLPYVNDITDVALQNIRTFIRNGGSYFGICAGAYFACSNVVFEVTTPIEVVGQRDLKLFQGIAKGAVYPGFQYSSTKGSRMVPLTCCANPKDNISDKSFAYFNGGCEFIPNDGFTDFQTLALYVDYPGKNAIVSIKIGNGQVILSGVHPEMDLKYLDPRKYTLLQWKAINEHAENTRNLFRWIIERLL